MNYGKSLVAHVLRNSELKPFLEAGLNLDWVTSREDLSVPTIFGTQDQAAYTFILRHWEKFRKLPSMDYFERSYPAQSYRLPDTEYTTSELISMLTEEIERARVEQAGSELVDLFEDGNYAEAARVMEAHARRLRQTRSNRSEGEYFDDPDTDVEKDLTRKIKRGMFTGIPELDGSFSGWQPGNLITYLGRAKAGKTSFALMSALHNWDRGKRVLFITVEMAKGEIIDRLNCQGAGVSLENLQTGKLSRREKERYRAFRKKMEEFDPAFRVEQTIGKFTVSDLEDFIENFEPDVVYIDGFYFMVDRISGKRGSNWEGHDNLAEELKETAMHYGLTIVTTTQVREKQLGGKGKGIDDGAMMGGTGLTMASDMVLTFDWSEDGVHRIGCSRSRTKYLPPVCGTWDWDTAEFTAFDEDDDD